MQLNVMPLSELLTTANNYATSIKELGIYSGLVKELCIRLDAGSLAMHEMTKQRDALAAEVYDVKHPGTYLPSKCETPATDAFLREVRAQGVEMFSEQQRSFIGKPSKNDAASSYCSREALKFADQLRQEASL